MVSNSRCRNSATKLRFFFQTKADFPRKMLSRHKKSKQSKKKKRFYLQRPQFYIEIIKIIGTILINANAPRRGNKPIAQGIALGTLEGSMKRPERAMVAHTSYPGRCPGLCACWPFRPTSPNTLIVPICFIWIFERREA